MPYVSKLKLFYSKIYSHEPFLINFSMLFFIYFKHIKLKVNNF